MSTYISIRPILVTTDFSENSFKAFGHAADIAKATNARIDLVNVLMREGFDTDAVIDADVKLRDKELENLKNTYFGDIKEHVKTRTIVTFKSVHEAIAHESEDNKHDLVVIATIGRTGLDYLMLGSTAASVVRHVSAPVLSVNPKHLMR